MAEDRKPRQTLEARIEVKSGTGRPRKVWMDDIKAAAVRRGKTIQEARSMAMTRKDFRRWTENPTLKGKRERQRRRNLEASEVARQHAVAALERELQMPHGEVVA
jgi:hypothetical protein